MQELPSNTQMIFEYGDPKVIKEKLGDKHIFSGLYPLSALKTKTKQECIDLAKNYIDILAPGGKYIFSFDKIPLVLGDLNMEKLCAVAETVRDYGEYSNAGEQVRTVVKKEDYTALPSRSIESKYYKTWDQYKVGNPEVSDFAAPKLQGFEEMLFSFIASLLM
ncbi:MAG: hypothetical protein ACOWWH_06175 [Eubacteriaceae bacterium]